MLHLRPLLCHRLLQQWHAGAVSIYSSSRLYLLADMATPSRSPWEIGYGRGCNRLKPCLHGPLKLRGVHEHLPHAELGQERVELLDVACTPHRRRVWRHMHRLTETKVALQGRRASVFPPGASIQINRASTDGTASMKGRHSPVKRFRNACVAFWPANKMRPACSPCVLRPARTSNSVVLPAREAKPSLTQAGQQVAASTVSA